MINLVMLTSSSILAVFKASRCPRGFILSKSFFPGPDSPEIYRAESGRMRAGMTYTITTR